MTRGFRDENGGKAEVLVDIDDVAYVSTSRSGQAYLVRDADDRDIWLPVSLVEKNSDGTFTMPEWLAKEKRLI